MLKENDPIIPQLQRVMAEVKSNSARQGMIIGWWLRDFEMSERHATSILNTVCHCIMCRWQRGEVRDW